MSHAISDTAPESIQISGLKFEHGTNGKYEYYYHTDHARVIWQVWRLLRGQWRAGWYASVHQPGPGGVDAILNSHIHKESHAHSDSQTEMNGDPEPSVLLCGLASIISSGELPQYESYMCRWIAPDATGIQAQSTTVMFFAECVGCRQLYAMKVERADYERLTGTTEFIQDLFPYLAPPMRELLISRTCPKCWRRIFGAEDTSAETRGLSLGVDAEER
jgi:hypothetical protein